MERCVLGMKVDKFSLHDETYFTLLSTNTKASHATRRCRASNWVHICLFALRQRKLQSRECIARCSQLLHV